jgi:uncharacterized membrane protein
MAEGEADHRRGVENAFIKAQADYHKRQFSEARFGQFCALTITVIAIVAGVYTAIQGHEIAGSVIGVGGIGGIVTTFIFGRHKHKPDEEKKSQPKQSNSPTSRSRKK